MLTPSGGGSPVVVMANQIQTVVASTKRVGFLMPAMTVAAPSSYQVSIADATDGFSSNNSVPLLVNPAASISALKPGSGVQGQSVTVTITGLYSNFLVGSTQVAVGGGITVSSVSVSGPTAISAKLTIPSSTPTGGQAVTVTTGGEVASLANGFMVTAAKTTVPNVAGDTQAAATSALTTAGLTVGTVTTQSSSTVASGHVISENPAAATSVNAGSAVNLVISSGPAQVKVPNVAGDTQAAATSALTTAGLTVGTVTTQSSSTVASGDVISENPTAGTSVNAGSAVNLVISSGPAQVKVPNVAGDTQAAATSALTTAGLTVGTVTTQSSSTVASGDVISENPTAGTSVNAGSAVNLVISSGPAQVKVPNVVGDTQAAASSALTTAGLTVGTVTTQSSSTVASGDVISENPTAGTSVNAGSAVNLVISSGPAQVKVPNVVGDTQAAATSALTTAGLIVGTVTTQSSSTVASGDVISENPTAGTSVNAGSAVNLVISSGPAQVKVPNVAGDTQAAATSALTTAGLTVGTVTTQSSSTVASGDVISENPTAGTSVNAGSAVNLVISSGPAQVKVPNVAGDTQAAASSALTTAGLTVGTVTTQSSSTVASGDVISENPTAGMSVNAGSAVNLVISSGPAKVSVPNVAGDTQAAASSALTTAGLTVGTVTTQSSSTVASGDVISENPTAGTSVNAGSAVNLVISSGPAQVKVPNVAGDTQAAASSALTTAGLTVGTVTTQSSSTVASGDVISENPTAGTSVNAGSAVNLVISSGPAQVKVPNVAGDTQAAAASALTTAGLTVGTVTTQSSSTVASGDVISENPTAGTSVNAGSAVNLVISSGPATATPVSINVNLSQFIVTAGASTTFTDVPVDQSGNPVAVTPNCGITADPVSASGTAPTISSGTIGTDNTTRGVYTLTCSLTSPSLTASVSFTVLLPTSTTVTTTQQATFAAFSGTTSSSSSLLHQINTALGSGNQADVNTALAQLQSNLNALDLDALDRAVAFAPEGGFPASPDKLPSFGINQTAADANVGTYLTNLISALQNLTSFLQTNPLATLTSSQFTTYKQLESTLATLVAQLPSLNPSAYGIVANADQEDQLFSDVLPQYYQALTQATIQYLTANGFTASILPRHRPEVLAQAGPAPSQWGDVQFVKTGLHSRRHGRGLGLAFQFGGLIEVELVSDIQMDLINQIYGPYFSYIAKAAATIVAKDAFQAWTGSLDLDGLISGGDLEIQIFYAAGSVIEGDNLNAIPTNNKVYFVGPDQINAVTDAVSYLQGLHKPKDLNDLDEQMEGFVDLFKTAKTAYNEMKQVPDSTYASCILGNSPPCIELAYNNGFNSVYQPGGLGLPAAVLVFVQNKPAGVWSTGIYEFEPAASQ